MRPSAFTRFGALLSGAAFAVLCAGPAMALVSQSEPPAQLPPATTEEVLDAANGVVHGLTVSESFDRQPVPYRDQVAFWSQLFLMTGADGFSIHTDYWILDHQPVECGWIAGRTSRSTTFEFRTTHLCAMDAGDYPSGTPAAAQHAAGLLDVAVCTGIYLAGAGLSASVIALVATTRDDSGTETHVFLPLLASESAQSWLILGCAGSIAATDPVGYDDADDPSKWCNETDCVDDAKRNFRDRMEDLHFSYDLATIFIGATVIGVIVGVMTGPPGWAALALTAAGTIGAIATMAATDAYVQREQRQAVARFYNELAACGVTPPSGGSDISTIVQDYSHCYGEDVPH